MRAKHHRRLGTFPSITTFLVLFGPGGQASGSTVDLNDLFSELREAPRSGLIATHDPLMLSGRLGG